MKKIFLCIFYFLTCIFSIHAQTLYGTTSAGGREGGGTIIKFLPATNNLSVVKSFATYGYGPVNTNFIQATDGKLYGTTPQGGSSGKGVIFSYDPLSAAYTILYSFDYDNGDHPHGSLIQAGNGKLYGVTSSGGSAAFGVIFSFDPSSATYAKVKDFDHTSGGGSLNGSLLEATDGKLYGMTGNGGSSDSGTIFSFDPSTSAYTKLKDFNKTDGANPYGSLIQAGNGKLYGVTNDGGSSDNGVIFSFDPASTTYTKLKDFDNTTGAHPQNSLLQPSDGKLYGMTTRGGSNDYGVIFSFDPSASTYTKLKEFDAASGADPSGSLVQANDGKLYGMTVRGGTLGEGVIFSFDPASTTYTKLKEFDVTNGSRPYGSLMQASDGKLYGLTNQGGGYGLHNSDDGLSSVIGTGVIFSFDPASTTYTKLRDFGISEGGEHPQGDLTAKDGKLYGFTFTGGGQPKYGFGYGVLFSFDPSTSAYTKLKNFDFDHGGNPVGKLVQAGNGKLYGLTTYGGLDSLGRAGVIYSFDPATSAYTMLKEFNDPVEGGLSEGSLVLATDGKLYGMAFGHFGTIPSPGPGFIFSFDPSTSVYAKLKDFDFTNGAHPRGSLVQATDGKLYGMTPEGGSLDSGVIFSFDPLSSTYTKLKDLNNAGGAIPLGSLIQATDGKLYGMTHSGGVKGYGVIFSFDPGSSAYTRLKDFDSSDGYGGKGLKQASDGKLYGMSTQSSTGVSVIFSFDPASSTYMKLQDFNGPNGADTRGSFIEVPEGGPLPVRLISFSGKNKGSNNELSWKVDIEQNLSYYELQRGIDGQNFKGVAQIKASGNNSYTYNDPIGNAVSSLYYYRLKSIDRDNGFKYSPVIKIRTGHNGFAVVNPNPFKNKLVVNIESLSQDKAAFIITDISGRQLYKENKLLVAGANIVEITEANKLSKGTYLLSVITSQQTQSLKIVKGN